MKKLVNYLFYALFVIVSASCISNVFAIEITTPEKVSSVLLRDSANNINTTDSEETFITGETPNNYIWYSGKLWRAISIDTSDNTVKLVTQWNQTTLAYNIITDPSFVGSYAEKWLNDTSSDGFLGNLYNYKNYIKEDSVWDYSLIPSGYIGSKPSKTNLATRVVGMVDAYEYNMTSTGTTAKNGYMNNQLSFWLLTPSAPTNLWYSSAYSGKLTPRIPSDLIGIRPSVNLLDSVEIVSGDGSSTNPYRLKDDTSLSQGAIISSGKSGEYVKFNNAVYRIITTDGTNTKLVALKSIKKVAYDTSGSEFFNPENSANIGYYLNNDWYNSLSDTDKNMMTDSKYYLGKVLLGEDYSTAKSEDVTPAVTAKVGLIRFGELMSGQFDINDNNTINLTITPTLSGYVVDLYSSGTASHTTVTNPLHILPTITLNNTAIIKSGTGLPNDPYILPTAEDFKKITYNFTSTDNPTDVTLPEDETIVVGTKYSAKELETTEDYTFNGWYTDENLTTKYVDETQIDDDLILFGEWKKTETQNPVNNNQNGNIEDSNTANPNTNDNITINMILMIISFVALLIIKLNYSKIITEKKN